MAKKNQNDHYDSILTKQNTEYNKISSEDFTLGFVKYLLGSTKTWEEVYQLIVAVTPRK